MAALVTMAGKMISAIREDDDFADRLNFRYSFSILIMFAFLITTKQLVGEPINCWTPAHFKKPHVSYANDYCWIRNTYYLPFEQEIPQDGQEKEQLHARGGHVVTYYQWAPLLLLLQAFFFKLPNIIWQNLGDNSGIDVGNLITVGQLLASVQMEDEVRQKLIKKMVRQADRYLLTYDALTDKRGVSSKLSSFTFSVKHVVNRVFCFAFGRHRTNYLVTLYIVTKFLYLANVVAQMLLLNVLLGTNYSTYGIDVLRAAANGEDWTQSPRFPRITMCDLKVRRLGAVHRYTIQCVLPINLFNEKIYLFLWFWFVFVAAATCVTTVSWLLRILIRRDRSRYIARYLNLSGRVRRVAVPTSSLRASQSPRRQVMKYDEYDVLKMHKFNEMYIRHDGAFLIRMMTSAANPLISMELTAALWDYYWKTHDLPPPASRRQLRTLSASAPSEYELQETLPVNGGRRFGRDDSQTIEKKRNNNEYPD